MTNILPGWKWVFGAITSLIALAAWLGTSAEHLLLGWLYFPLRVVPQITVDPPAAALGTVALVAFVVGLHFTVRWLLSGTRSSDKAPLVWPWRSTIALALVLLLMFAAGTAMVGATHQFVWLLTGRATSGAISNEPVRGNLDSAVLENDKFQRGSDIKQFGFGVHAYHDIWKSLPVGGTMNDDGQMLHGWASFIAPFTGYTFDGIDYSVPWNKPPNDRFFKCNLTPFNDRASPGPHFDEHGFGLARVAGNVHVLPIRQVRLPPDRRETGVFDVLAGLRDRGELLTLEDISDGTSQTLLFGTAAENLKPWGHPANLRDPARGINTHPDGFGGPPGWGGAQFTMCDGSVRFFSEKTDPRVLAQLATPSGGERGETAPQGQNAR